MLWDYGFLNPADVAADQATLPLLDHDALHGKRVTLLGRDFAYIFEYLNGPSIMRLFRLINARTEEEVDLHLRQTSWHREYRAAQACRNLLSKRYLNKPTSIAEDYGLLHTSSGRKRLAIQYRIGQKKILIRTERFCSLVLSEILPCTPAHAIRYPNYTRMLRIAAQSV